MCVFYFFSCKQVPKKAHKKGRVSEQEQLATKLDKALSLTKLGKFNKSSCRFTDTSSSGKSRASGGSGGGSSGSKRPALSDADARTGRPGKSGLSKDLSSSFAHKSSSKGGKSKTAGKTKTPEASLKGRSQRKVSYSPARSELSSFSNSKSQNDDHHNNHLPGHLLELRLHVQILASSD